MQIYVHELSSTKVETTLNEGTKDCPAQDVTEITIQSAEGPVTIVLFSQEKVDLGDATKE